MASLLTRSKPRQNAESESGMELYIEGLSSIIENQKEIAIKQLSRAVELDSNLTGAYYHLGILFSDKKDSLRAQKIFRDLLLREHLEKSLKEKTERALIKAYCDTKKFSSAQMLAEQRVDRYPEDLEARHQLTHLLEMQGNYSAAEKNWKIYCQLSGESTDAKLALYQVELVRSDPNMPGKEKKKVLQKAIKLHQKCAPAYMLLARLYREEQKPEKVLECWAQLLDNAPEKSPWILPEIEQYLYEINRYHELLGIYQKLVRQSGSHQTVAKLGLFKQYLKLGEKEEALDTLKSIESHKLSKQETLRELLRFSLENQSGNQPYPELKSALAQLPDIFTYSCQSCGRISKEPEWHCPDCGHWDSFEL